MLSLNNNIVHNVHENISDEKGLKIFSMKLGHFLTLHIKKLKIDMKILKKLHI